MTINVTNTPFKNSNGTHYLQGLFFEKAVNKNSIIYTLKNEDHLGYTSLYRLYMECEDLTEWSFAIAYMDSWEHWEKLCECEWFKPYLNRWRKELQLKLASDALKTMVHIAAGSSREAYGANKYILDNGYFKKTPKEDTRGRPSKEEVKGKLKEESEFNKELQEDMKRLDITIN